jgi:hypothetical protein
MGKMRLGRENEIGKRNEIVKRKEGENEIGKSK